MPNTALNRTTQVLLTNKSGGNLAYGDVVVLDNTNTNGFTTTTTAGLSTRGLGVILEPSGIANNASGMVAVGGWCPKVNLNTAAAVGQFVKTHTVAGQGTPHASPQVEGDFAVALSASATPACNLFGSPNGPLAGVTAGSITTSGLTMNTARLLGRTTASSGAVEEITVGTGLSLSAGALTASGSSVVVQVKNVQTGTMATGSTTVPIDNTIPQNTEGNEFMTLAITPTNSSNKLKIEVVCQTTPNFGDWVITALFQDSTANALAAFINYQGANGGAGNNVFTHYMTAGTTSATTFKVRAGGSAQAVTFNGGSGNPFMGGVMASSITITEIVP